MDTQNLQSRLRQWSERLDSLKTNEEKVASRDRGEFQRQLDLIDAKIGTLQDRLSGARSSNGRGNGELDANIRKLLHELNDAFDSAMAKLM